MCVCVWFIYLNMFIWIILGTRWVQMLDKGWIYTAPMYTHLLGLQGALVEAIFLLVKGQLKPFQNLLIKNKISKITQRIIAFHLLICMSLGGKTPRSSNSQETYYKQLSFYPWKDWDGFTQAKQQLLQPPPHHPHPTHVELDFSSFMTLNPY